MLRSEHELFEHQYYERTLDLSIKELEVERSNFSITMSVAALIAGFASSIIVGPLTIDIGPLMLKVGVYLCTVLCIACECYSILVAAICMIRGPDLAYRGASRKSVQKAVDAMVAERPLVFWSFIAGLMLFFLAAIGLVWVKLGVEGNELRSWYSTAFPMPPECHTVLRRSFHSAGTRGVLGIDELLPGAPGGVVTLYRRVAATVLSVLVACIMVLYTQTLMRLMLDTFNDEPDEDVDVQGMPGQSAVPGQGPGSQFQSANQFSYRPPV
eukprot:gene13786-16294_t